MEVLLYWDCTQACAFKWASWTSNKYFDFDCVLHVILQLGYYVF